LRPKFFSPNIVLGFFLQFRAIKKAMHEKHAHDHDDKLMQEMI